MVVEFDSAHLELVEAVPGPLLGDKPLEVRAVLPTVDIDNQKGILRYTDVRTGPTTPPTPRLACWPL